MLYQLIITDLELSYDSHMESFNIGLFRSREEAERTAAFYLSRVKGFCDYPCTYEIHERVVYGESLEINDVFIAVGWDTNENDDEIDIIESPCFVSESQACAALQQMKKDYPRAEWAVDRWRLDRAEWSEGFIRD